MSQTFNPGSSLGDSEEYEYEYEYVEEEVGADGVEYEYVDEDGNPVTADGEPIEYEYVDESGNPVAAAETTEEVEYEYVDEDGNPVSEDGEEVEYEYVDEDGNPVSAEDAAAYEDAEEEPVAETSNVIHTEVSEDGEYEYSYETYEEEVEEEIQQPTKPLNEVDDSLASAREVPAWVVSAGVHIAVLLALGMISRVIPIEPSIPPITTVTEELTPEDYKFDASVQQDVIGSDSNVNQISPSQQAAVRMGETPQEMMEQQIEESFETADVPPPVDIVQPHESEFVSNVDLNGATEYIGGTEGAIDRLAFEIAGSLKERKTLVVWMFDASQSLVKQRAQIADRFENVYKQVGALEVSEDEKALRTAVVSYGQGMDYITKEPVYDVTEVAEAVRSIKNDTSGKENVFSAVEAAAKKYRIYRTSMQRNIMFVLVTDERGDDYGKLESTIATCRRYGIKVYTVGPACIFGKEKSYVDWTYEDGYTEELPVDGGPETVAQERLNLGFWGVNGRDLERMSAGYGPYALTRLSAETGGMYLINADTKGPRFDPVVMKNYLPDYRPISVYQRELTTNLAKGRLVETARVNNEATNVPNPRLSFDADNDTILRQQITEAQKPAAVFDYHVAELHASLEPGLEHYEKLESPRWRASFDLAMGRVLAMRVRAYGYNAVLADMKATPKSFEKKDSNSWRLRPSDKITAGPSVKKLAKKAEEHLKRVIDDHPGTPWALLAERELSSPMGWEWQEFGAPRAAMNNNRNNNNNNNIQLAEEERRRQQMMQRQKTRQKPNL